MIDFRKHYLAVALISATLGGCSGGGDDGSAVVIDPEPSTPPAATPAVNAGDDQEVIEDDLVSLEATTSGFSGNASLTYNWRRVDGPYMIFSDASVADPEFVAPDVASEQQIVWRLLPAMAQPPSRTPWWSLSRRGTSRR